MIRFFEFFHIVEVMASSSPVALQRHGDVLMHTFSSPSKSGKMGYFEVMIQPIPKAFMAADLGHDLGIRGHEALSKIKSVKGFNISFKEESDSHPVRAYMPTGKSASPTHVITEVISAVKTLIEVERPKVLQFYGSTVDQKSVYHKLYTIFLRPAGYQLVENSLGMDYYVHTDLLQELLGARFEFEMSKFSAKDVDRKKQLKAQKRESPSTATKPQSVRKGIFTW